MTDSEVAALLTFNCSYYAIYTYSKNLKVLSKLSTLSLLCLRVTEILIGSEFDATFRVLNILCFTILRQFNVGIFVNFAI